MFGFLDEDMKIFRLFFPAPQKNQLNLKGCWLIVEVWLNPWKPVWGAKVVARSHGFSNSWDGPKVQKVFRKAIHAWAISIEWGHPQVTDFLHMDTGHDETRIWHRDAEQDLGSGRFGQLKGVEGCCSATHIAHGRFYMDASNRHLI